MQYSTCMSVSSNFISFKIDYATTRKVIHTVNITISPPRLKHLWFQDIARFKKSWFLINTEKKTVIQEKIMCGGGHMKMDAKTAC